MLGPLRVPNRIMLAPLAGIGNWFVRLQAKRYGAGMAVSEMVSSYAVHHRNRKTITELLRIDEREHAGGPVAIQLFGEEPAVMRSAARTVAAAGADVIDINMGCPVPKVARTGAGAGLLADPDRAVALARAAVAGAGEAREGVPVTVKIRSGLRVGDRSGFELAHRLVEEAGVAAIAFHPRAAAVHHKGSPDYALVAELARTLPAPVILSGGLYEEDHVREVLRATGAAAVMLARGALGNPWLFEQLLGRRAAPPARREVRAELEWTMQRAAEHLGEERAARYLRKFYPWYVPRLGLPAPASRELQQALQRSTSLAQARGLLAAAESPLASAA
jgi:nifR3 family TIM-barrel protein